MPKKHSDTQKREAIDLLNIHNDITLVHQLTGIPRRTLRRWRAQSPHKQKRYMTEKNIPSAKKRPQPDDHTKPSPPPPPANDAAPGKSSVTNHDRDALLHIRGQLMNFARCLADRLDPDDPDVNRRTLSLTRVLDRIHWLDENMQRGEDETDQTASPNRIKYLYENEADEPPPQREASE